MLREFLYVDVTRTKSFLAQLDEGVVEKVVQTGTQRTSLAGELTAWVAKGVRSSDTETGIQESKSMQDLFFALFEQYAESVGLIRTVEPDLITGPADWEASVVHSRFEEGELLRIATPILIIDHEFLITRFNRFLRTSDRLNELNRHNRQQQIDNLRQQYDQETENLIEAGQYPGRDRDDRRKAAQAFRKERSKRFQSLVAAVDEEYSLVGTEGLSEVINFLEAYMASDAIYVQFLACGDEHPEYSFVGSLLARDDYMQREREALYTRYGARLEGWTSVVQVARIATQEETEEASAAEFANLRFVSDTGIKRAHILSTAARLENKLEAQGLAEGAVWPSISVTPLAIYRSVPRSDQDTPYEGTQ